MTQGETDTNMYVPVITAVAAYVSDMSQQCVCVCDNVLVILMVIHSYYSWEEGVMNNVTMSTFFMIEEYANKSVITTQRKIAICLKSS